MELIFGSLEMQATCGELEFKESTVAVGGVATLIYKPASNRATRKWYKESPTKLILIYDSGNSSTNIRYVEAAQGEYFDLSIKGVVNTDAGRYIVSCYEDGRLYSGRATLNVTGVSCGSLTVKENNLQETQIAILKFEIQPGRSIKWEKKINSTFQQLPPKDDDYEMTKNGDETIQSIRIYSSEFSDSGEYRVNCDIAVSNSVYLYIVPTAPTVPEFSRNESIPECKECILAELNVSVNVECFVKGGTNPVLLTMFRDRKTISNVNYFNTSKNAVHIFHARHTFVPSTMDFDVVFTCTVKNPALTVELVKSAKLYIRVDPKTVKLKVKQTTENEANEIQCITKEGRPPKKSSILIEKKKDDEAEKTNEVKTEHTFSVTTTLIKNFTRFDNQKEVMCCSDILKFICSNRSHVNVLFPPEYVSISEIMKRNEDNGDTVLKLECSVAVSNPRSSIEWKGVKGVLRTPIMKNNTADSETHGWKFSTIWEFNLTKDDNGRRLRCEVRNEKFPNLELNQLYRPNITYAPVIKASGPDYGVAYLGDDVFLTCHVDSNPPSTLSWYNQTDLIKESYGVKDFDLHLVNITFDHSQTYTCTAQNTIGSKRSKNVTLVVKDDSEKPVTKPTSGKEPASSSLAGPIIGCLVALIAIIIAVTVFLYWRKKRQNTPLERKGTYQIKIEDRKPSVHPDGHEPVYNNVATTSSVNAQEEQIEYAFVIPKSKREKADASLVPTNDAGNDTPDEQGNNLIYAELDLNQDANNAVKRPLVVKDEPTEYVSIDFHKTGTVTINEDC